MLRNRQHAHRRVVEFLTICRRSSSCSVGLFHGWPPQTRKEFKERADVELSRCLEKEKVRDYFLDNNDGWQMQALTRHVEEDESDRRRRIESVESDRARDGDLRRQGLCI